MKYIRVLILDCTAFVLIFIIKQQSFISVNTQSDDTIPEDRRKSEICKSENKLYCYE